MTLTKNQTYVLSITSVATNTDTWTEKKITLSKRTIAKLQKIKQCAQSN